MYISKVATQIFAASGTGHTSGLVPDPGSTSGSTRFLREDASWSVPPFDRGPARGRMTIVSGDPLNTAGTASGTTLYFTPFGGSAISLYDGTSAWHLYSFGELSVTVPSTAGMYDLFLYDSSGTLTLQTVAWTNVTTRATSVVLQDNVYVKSGDTTKRYLGSFYSTSGTAYDSATKRHVWNYYNRARKKMVVHDSTGFTSWTYGNSGVWRQANANSGNTLGVAVGKSESYTEVAAYHMGSPADASYYATGIGYDSTTASISECGGRTGGIGGLQGTAIATVNHLTGEGLHAYNWLEVTALAGSTAVNFYANVDGSTFPTGMVAMFWC